MGSNTTLTIALAGAIVLLLVAVCCLCCRLRKKRKEPRSTKYQDNDQEEDEKERKNGRNGTSSEKPGENAFNRDISDNNLSRSTWIEEQKRDHDDSVILRDSSTTNKKLMSPENPLEFTRSVNEIRNSKIDPGIESLD